MRRRMAWQRVDVRGRPTLAKHQANSKQILPGDDFAETIVVADELPDELVQPALEDVVHVAVLQAIADATGMTLRRALAAVSDADLAEIADKVLVAARQRTRQRVVQDQEIGD